ncbi:hypothetical protein [Phytohabitans kaempferiae]|uniref:DUF732 domain-containing protein n=1 Tax=Phytohabitans kaempferiae TaxID=1620943 RepID=A0ABV6LV56_9ACTN
MTTTAPHEPVSFHDPHKHRRITYIVAGAVIVVLLVLGLAMYNRAEHNAAAEAKADQLIALFQAEELPVPDRDQIIRTLGDDGGAMCADPGNALKKAIRDGLGSNGAAGPGQRPVFIAERTIKGEKLALSVYCPDQLPEFQTYTNGLNLDDVVKE